MSERIEIWLRRPDTMPVVEFKELKSAISDKILRDDDSDEAMIRLDDENIMVYQCYCTDDPELQIAELLQKVYPKIFDYSGEFGLEAQAFFLDQTPCNYYRVRPLR